MEKIKKAVSAAEEDQVSRKLLVWLNTYPELPVDLIRFEFLPADTSAMAMSTIQAAYIVRKYITGGYVAEYQFKIIYRVKPGNSNDKRLKADELLNAIGDWANGQAMTSALSAWSRPRDLPCLPCMKTGTKITKSL